MLLPPPRPRTASGRKSAAGRDARVGQLERRLRLAAVEDLDGDAGFAERSADRLDEAGLDQDRIGDEQNARAPPSRTAMSPSWCDGVAAEHELAGRVEGPGGTHVEAPGLTESARHGVRGRQTRNIRVHSIVHQPVSRGFLSAFLPAGPTRASEIHHDASVIRIGIVTVSDRASRGVYEDRGRPRHPRVPDARSCPAPGSRSPRRHPRRAGR